MEKSNRHILLGLLLSIILVLYLLQAFVGFGIRHNLNVKASYVSTHDIHARIVVLGPCEPLWMVAPERITKKTGLPCYNLANSHSDFADNYLHLYLYLKNNPAPSCLALFVTPESFDTNYNTFYAYRFAAFLEDTLVANTVRICDPTYFRWTALPFMKYAYYNHQILFSALQGWKHYIGSKSLPYHPDGFEPPAKIIWDNHYENLKKKYPFGYYFGWNALREVYLHKILALCKAKGIAVILYESPVLKETALHQPNRKDFMERIALLAKNEGVPFFSFENLALASDKKNYVSPMVTRLAGSYQFSDTLGGFLNKWIIR